jgi:hypothetical protein
MFDNNIPRASRALSRAAICPCAARDNEPQVAGEGKRETGP